MTLPIELTDAVARVTRAEAELRRAVKERNAVIAGLIASDYPRAEIASELGVSGPRVSQMVRAHKEAPDSVGADPGPDATEVSRERRTQA